MSRSHVYGLPSVAIQYNVILQFMWLDTACSDRPDTEQCKVCAVSHPRPPKSVNDALHALEYPQGTVMAITPERENKVVTRSI